MAAQYKCDQYWEDLVAHTSCSYEFHTRVNVMQALKRLNHCNQQVVKHPFRAYLTPNNRLSNPAKEVLNCFMAQHKYEKVIKSYYQEEDWEAWELDELGKVVKR